MPLDGICIPETRRSLPNRLSISSRGLQRLLCGLPIICTGAPFFIKLQIAHNMYFIGTMILNGKSGKRIGTAPGGAGEIDAPAHSSCGSFGRASMSLCSSDAHLRFRFSLPRPLAAAAPSLTPFRNRRLAPLSGASLSSLNLRNQHCKIPVSSVPRVGITPLFSCT